MVALWLMFPLDYGKIYLYLDYFTGFEYDHNGMDKLLWRYEPLIVYPFIIGQKEQRNLLYEIERNQYDKHLSVIE